MVNQNKPVANPGETLVHLHFINPDTQDRSTWIGDSVTRALRASGGRIILDVSIDVGAAPSDTTNADAMAPRGFRIGDLVEITGLGDGYDGKIGVVTQVDHDPVHWIGLAVDGFVGLVWCNSTEVRHLDGAGAAAGESSVAK